MLRRPPRNEYTLGVMITVPQSGTDLPVVETYDLVISYTIVDLDTNATIKHVTNVADMAEYEVGANTVTITMKFGTTLPTDLKWDPDKTKSNFVLNGVGATAKVDDDKIVVTSQSGKQKTYTIVPDMRPALTSFEIPGQIGETEIKTDESKPFMTHVTVTMPYGTEDDEKIPTFTLGEDIENVSYSYNDSFEFINGVDPLVIDKNGNALTLWKGEIGEIPDGQSKDEGTTHFNVAVTVNYAKNTEAVLNTIKVGGSNVTTVVGNDVTVEMPKGYDFATNGKSVKVELTGSPKANVEVLAQPNVEPKDPEKRVFNDDGELDLTKVNITSKSFKIRVTSEEEGVAANEYTVTLTTAAEAGTKLVVNAKKDDEDTIYSAVFNGDEGVLTLPYAARAKAEASKYTLFYSASTGASIFLKDYSNNGTNATLDTNLCNVFTTHGPDTVRTFVVTNGQDNKATYTLTIKYEDPQYERELTSATLVDTNNVAEIKEDNTYNTVLGTAKMGKETVNTLRVNVPYTFGDDGNWNVYASDLKLSEGAVAFVVRHGDGAEELTVLDPKAKGNQDVANIKLGLDEDVLNDDGSVIESAFQGDAESSIIYVFSEKGYVDFGGADVTTWEDIDDIIDAGMATAYYVYAEKAAPQTGAELISVDAPLYEDISVEMKANNTIEITVPYSYDKNNRTDKTPVNFTLNFRQSSMDSEIAREITDGNELVADFGDAEAAKKATKLDVNKKQLFFSKGGWSFDTIYVASEDYEAGNEAGTVTKYDVVVKVADVEKGAELTSVKAAGVTGTFSGKTINLVLPYGTDKYPVVLDLEASKMASITVDGEPYDPTTGYDLNSDVKIVVSSENNANKTEYTLKTTVAESFFDVTTDDWFYEEVMQAAENGWVNGQSAGYFGPDGTMKRGDFALIIARIKNYNPALYTEAAFPDVDVDDYYAAAIAYCKEKGYLAGDDKGYFNPEDAITREQMAKIMCEAAGVEQVTDPAKPYADDASIADWAKGYVYGCQAEGIMNGDESANLFDAKDNATRAEAAAVLVRAFA